MQVNITKENLKEIVNKNKIVLIDFWAPWCGPCKLMNPIVEELAEELEGKAIIGKVNVDEEKELALNFQIRSIPTLLIIVNKEIKEVIVGAVNKGFVYNKLKNYL